MTIVTALMGIPNMDFTVRELRYAVDGPMAFIRVGTCGNPTDIKVGEIVTPSRFHTVFRKPDGFMPGAKEGIEECYYISKDIPVNPELFASLKQEVKKHFKTEHCGSGVTCCSFYSSQGRQDPNFDDKNEALIDYFIEKFPDLTSLEMESSHLIDLANVSKQKIYAASAHIVLAQRKSQDFLADDDKHRVEHEIGIAALDAIVNFQFEDDKNLVENPVWNHKGEPLGQWEQFKSMF